MKFIVMSRREAEKYIGDHPYGVISTTDPEAPAPRLQHDPMRKGRLLRTFHDIGNLGEPDDGVSIPMSRDDARAICEFYDRMKTTEVGTLVVHCEAGISRSRGVALALSTIDGDSSEHMSAGRPNHHVVQTILNLWRERTGESMSTNRVFEPWPTNVPNRNSNRNSGR